MNILILAQLHLNNELPSVQLSYAIVFSEVLNNTMPLSAAEKMRRYRAKIKESDRYEEVLQKDRNRWQERKRNGKIKPISEKSARQQRQQRRTWKQAQVKCRQRKASTKNLATPPSTPCTSTDTPPSFSRQKLQAILKKRQQKARVEYDLKKVASKMKQYARLAEMYKKRLQREKARNKLTDTPRTKTRLLLRHATSKEVRKTLTFHHAVVDSIRSKYRETSEERKKQMYCRLVTSGIMKQYRLKTMAQQKLGFSAKRWQTKMQGNEFVRKPYKSASTRYGNRVEEFFVRDDVSRMTAGKKQTVTRNKNKQQKRFLNDSIKNLYVKFMAENTDIKLSCSTFRRLKPFWVVCPKETDRDTCQCRMHENLQYLVTKLKEEHVIAADCLESVVESVVCNVNSKSCMYNECAKCRDNRLPVESHDQNAETSWTQWKVVTESRNIKKRGQNEIKAVTLTVKEMQTGFLSDLIAECEDQLQRFKTHYFNMRHQYASYRDLRNSMGANEALIHIDFAENYVAKLASSVQSAHFGASQHQITLHTGVYYVGPNSSPATFCSVSDSLEHSPPGIWAFMRPAIDSLLKTHANVNVLHFFSDGPTSQYRQKGNFYLFAQLMLEKGIQVATWNFHEAGHGKGIPDAVGASVKRVADSIVARGKDIPNAGVMYRELVATDSAVRLHYISEQEVLSAVESYSAVKLQAIAGTMRIHQLITDSGELSHRVVSCFCSENRLCNCYGRKNVKMHVSAVAPRSVAMKDSVAAARTQPTDISRDGGDQTGEVLELADQSMVELNDRESDTANGVDVVLESVASVEHLLNNYVVVKYDGRNYPGKVVDIDTQQGEVQVSCMHKVGHNRFFWPARADLCWYTLDDILAVISEPTKVTGRHFQIETEVFNSVIDSHLLN